MSPNLLCALRRGYERDPQREAAIRRYGGPRRSRVNRTGGGTDHGAADGNERRRCSYA
jgi:hypothetical protein